jgi:hypothetical protein
MLAIKSSEQDARDPGALCKGAVGTASSTGREVSVGAADAVGASADIVELKNLAG